MIYFDTAVKKEILSKMSEALAPGGYLVLGASETAAGLTADFDLLPLGKTSVWRRKG